AKVGADVVQTRLLAQLRSQRLGLLLQRFDADSAAVFDDQLEPAGLAETRNRRRAIDGYFRFGNLLIPGSFELADDGLGAKIRTSPLLEGFQDHVHRGPVGRAAAASRTDVGDRVG